MGTSRGGAMVVGVHCLVTLVAMASFGSVHSTLTTGFYVKSCPSLTTIVKKEIQKAVKAEKRMAASLVRLHFHDCFVQGCDGSVLLDDAPGISSEKSASGNSNSLRGFEVIDTIKAKLEQACPRTVSCADILAIASRDSAVEVGLVPEYPVFLGRRDRTTGATADFANQFLPGPNMSYSDLKVNFANVSLDETDLVALSGAHTIGRIRCQLVRLFGVNIPNTNTEFRANLAKQCPGSVDFSKFLNLDHTTPDEFDNNYYKNLFRGEGIIPSDQALLSHVGRNLELVKDFAQNPENFFRQFARSSIKMGNIGVLEGKNGEVRVNCRVVNKKSDLIESLIALE